MSTNGHYKIYAEKTLARRLRQGRIVKTRNHQDLVWNIIYFMAIGYFDERYVNTSDVFVSIPGAKDTISKVITKMVAMEIFEKTLDPNDKRFRRLSFTNNFESKIKRHIAESIDECREIVKSIDERREYVCFARDKNI